MLSGLSVPIMSSLHSLHSGQRKTTLIVITFSKEYSHRTDKMIFGIACLRSRLGFDKVSTKTAHGRDDKKTGKKPIQ